MGSSPTWGILPYSIVVSTWDFESRSPSSILGEATRGILLFASTWHTLGEEIAYTSAKNNMVGKKYRIQSHSGLPLPL